MCKFITLKDAYILCFSDSEEVCVYPLTTPKHVTAIKGYSPTNLLERGNELPPSDISHLL